MGQEVTFGQIVQTQRKEERKQAFRQIVQTQKEKETMLEKIRRFYWKQRDRGLGRQTDYGGGGRSFILNDHFGSSDKKCDYAKK